jgi:DNA-directed RNA polymerase specialized sigma24 family protein
LSQQAFEKLLCSFSTDREDAGAQYEVIRRKLVRFFEWRGIDSADEHADETINRVARRLDEGQVIENLKGYFYGVARIVFMEQLKERERSPVALDDAPQSLRFCVEEDPEPEARVVCFEKCLESLPADNQKLIISYYQEEKRVKIELRQELANRLQIPLNALRIRAHRIRVSLEKCISNCLQMSEDAK